MKKYITKQSITFRVGCSCNCMDVVDFAVLNKRSNSMW